MAEPVDYALGPATSYLDRTGHEVRWTRLLRRHVATVFAHGRPIATGYGATLEEAIANAMNAVFAAELVEAAGLDACDEAFEAGRRSA